MIIIAYSRVIQSGTKVVTPTSNVDDSQNKNTCDFLGVSREILAMQFIITNYGKVSRSFTALEIYGNR